MPKVSVVIPTYNMARFLPEAIESVLYQSFRDFELIIMDDGSTDSTSQVVAPFLPYLKYFRQENEGPSVARNRGSEFAQGEYICFLDADDTLLKEALMKGVAALDSAPQAGFSYGQVDYMDECGKDLDMRRRWPKLPGLMTGREVLLQLLDLNFILPSAALFRSVCYREVGGWDEGLRSGEDTELFVRLVKKYPVVYLAEPLARRRKHRMALTAELVLERQEKMWFKILEVAAEPPAFGLGKRRLAFYVYSALARQAYGSRLGKERHYIIKALRSCWPPFKSRQLAIMFYLFAKSLRPQPVRALVGQKE